MGGHIQHSGHKPNQRRRSRPMSDINVTPMVDVMLVLLIVFMVTAPLLTVGIPVDLPKVKAKTLESKSEPVVITVNKQGQVYIKEHETNVEALIAQLITLQKQDPEMRVYVRGDKELPYGVMMTVMSRLNNAGIAKVALVADPKQSKEPLAAPTTPAAQPKG